MESRPPLHRCVVEKGALGSPSTKVANFTLLNSNLRVLPLVTVIMFTAYWHSINEIPLWRPPLHLGVVAIEKGAFRPPSTNGRRLSMILNKSNNSYINNNMLVCNLVPIVRVCTIFVINIQGISVAFFR